MLLTSISYRWNLAATLKKYAKSLFNSYLNNDSVIIKYVYEHDR